MVKKVMNLYKNMVKIDKFIDYYCINHQIVTKCFFLYRYSQAVTKSVYSNIKIVSQT